MENPNAQCIDWLKSQCNKYVNGQCATLRCMKRGEGTATCEAHEALERIKDAEKDRDDYRTNSRSLFSQNEALMRDVERMDWLSSHAPATVAKDGVWFLSIAQGADWSDFKGDTLRSAIDTAAKEIE